MCSGYSRKRPYVDNLIKVSARINQPIQQKYFSPDLNEKLNAEQLKSVFIPSLTHKVKIHLTLLSFGTKFHSIFLLMVNCNMHC